MSFEGKVLLNNELSEGSFIRVVFAPFSYLSAN